MFAESRSLLSGNTTYFLLGSDEQRSEAAMVSEVTTDPVVQLEVSQLKTVPTDAAEMVHSMVKPVLRHPSKLYQDATLYTGR